MKTCEAYYENGSFIPIGLEEMPEGTKATITIHKPPKSVEEKRKAFNELMKLIRAAEDEEMPEIEPITTPIY